MTRPLPLLCLLAVLLGTGTAAAEPGPRVVKLTVTPAVPPTPALKYHLLPWVGELRPGNGAVFYQRAHSPDFVQILSRPAEFSQFTESLDKPWSREMADKLDQRANIAAVSELDVAARCEYVDWQLSDRFREENYFLLIPDVQAMRSLAALLAVRARLEMHRGELDKAVYSLQTGLALGRDVAHTPSLVCGLVGLAVSGIMLNRAEELIQLPATPNLYWALTDLPEPLIDLRRALQGERMQLGSLLPEIRDALKGPRLTPVAPATIRARLDRLNGLGLQLPGAGYAALFAMEYPRARDHFLAQGYRAEQLEELPVSQVVLMYELAVYDRWMDAQSKLWGLPYWQARPVLARVNEEMIAARRERVDGIIAAQLIPAVMKIYLAQVRLQRRVALLRTVEAIRLHAATQGGKLPDALEDVQVVPVPTDPMTGKLFHYHRHAPGRATLEGLPPPGEAANEGNAVRYEITLGPAPPKQ